MNSIYDLFSTILPNMSDVYVTGPLIELLTGRKIEDNVDYLVVKI